MARINCSPPAEAPKGGAAAAGDSDGVPELIADGVPEPLIDVNRCVSCGDLLPLDAPQVLLFSRRRGVIVAAVCMPCDSDRSAEPEEAAL